MSLTEPSLEAGGVPSSGEVVARSARQLFWRRLRDDRVALVALAFLCVLFVVAVAAPLVVDVAGAPPPERQSTEALDDFGSPTGPSAAHLLGVDELGRDVFSRVVYGARVSLEVALLSTGIAVLVGTAIGMAAGFYRGWVDTVLSRLMDVLLAFPILLLGLGLASACALGDGCLGGIVRPGISTVVFVIALASWPYFARVVRGQVLSLREREFVEASRAIGASNLRIMRVEVLPNLAAPIIVYTTLIIPTNILFEAALSFLGVGVQPPTASWGQMIAEAAPIFDTAWWYMVFPGLALLLTVLAFNLVGDGLQDALNPKTDP
ncbi:MAG TPA: ABC transporter permease [Solirubrobacteraceae bacterium]|nr:ABC transporter permease [Solirubrobacteraceae bacterium]